MSWWRVGEGISDVCGVWFNVRPTTVWICAHCHPTSVGQTDLQEADRGTGHAQKIAMGRWEVG